MNPDDVSALIRVAGKAPGILARSHRGKKAGLPFVARGPDRAYWFPTTINQESLPRIIMNMETIALCMIGTTVATLLALSALIVNVIRSVHLEHVANRRRSASPHQPVRREPGASSPLSSRPT
jgi:hypothetical protein